MIIPQTLILMLVLTSNAFPVHADGSTHDISAEDAIATWLQVVLKWLRENGAYINEKLAVKHVVPSDPSSPRGKLATNDMDTASNIRGSQVITDDSKTCLSPGIYEDHDWYEMPTEAREAAAVLGYSQVSWDLGSEPALFLLSWSALSGVEQAASIAMGCDAQCTDYCYLDGSTISQFDTSLHDDSECMPWSYRKNYWDDMGEDIQAAAAMLGYSQVVWDMGGLSPKEDYLWTDLTSEEQAAGQALGFDEQTWNNC